MRWVGDMGRPSKKADILDVIKRGPSWVIMRDGVQISEDYPHMEPALRRMDVMVKANKSQLRRCMACQQEFMSEGIHNRMCGPCRNKTEGMM